MLLIEDARMVGREAAADCWRKWQQFDSRLPNITFDLLAVTGE